MQSGSQRWVLLLLVVNILLTLTVLMRQETGRGGAPEKPEVLAEKKVNAYGQQVVDAYNSGNVERLYGLYHEDARVKLTREEVAAQLERLKKLFGVVRSLSYLNNLKLGEKGSQTYFQVHYNARVGNPELDQAQLVLHLIQENGKLALYGMRLNAAQP